MAMSRPSSSSPGDVPQIKHRVALLQFPVTADKAQNLRTARDYLRRARAAGARLCVLPEVWNSPYAAAAFPEYAETLPDVGDALADRPEDAAAGRWGPSAVLLMETAAATGMHVVGGSVPERDPADGRVYNACLVVDPAGRIAAKHRKAHLFDIDVPGGVRFRESETLTGGDAVTSFDADDGGDGGLGRVGVGICYDIRFPEYALLLTQRRGCSILVYPGAFNLTTGPAHWELLQRARAVDGQCFVLTASPARTPATPPSDGAAAPRYPHYAAWGHSTIVDPWGTVVATCDERPALVVADLDMDKVREVRTAIPTRQQKRRDLYRLDEGDRANEKTGDGTKHEAP